MEPFRNALLHEQPRTRATHFALIEPNRIDDALDGTIEIGIFEDDKRRLPAEFERKSLTRTRGRFSNAATDVGRAREGDLVDARMRDERGSRRAVAADDG